MNGIKSGAVAALIIAALALTGCGGTPTLAAQPQSTPAEAPAAMPTPDPIKIKRDCTNALGADFNQGDWEDCVEAKTAGKKWTKPPKPVDTTGTLKNPYPVGSEMVISESGGNELYTYTAHLVDGNADGALAEANQFNDLAPAGMKYLLIEATFTGKSDVRPIRPGVEAYSMQVATPDGRLFQQATVVTPGEGISGAPELYNGQSFTGQIAYIVPGNSDSWYLTSLGTYLIL